MTVPFSPDDLSALESSLDHRFSIDSRIESGGQGHVYRAERQRNPDGEPAAELVALKIFRPQGTDERVDREVAALQKIRHASLAGIIEVGDVEVESESLSYIAYEFVEGETLKKCLTSTELSFYEVAAVGRDVASAVDKIWERRIVHRDVKPSNIIVRPVGDEAVLVDLAYARHLGEKSLTTYGKTYGTQGYMSPEQWLWAERELTCKSDVFSLAVSLLEAATGRHPTRSDQKKLANAPPDPSEVLDFAPSGFVPLLRAMLSQRAAFRPDAATVVERFSELSERLAG